MYIEDTRDEQGRKWYGPYTATKVQWMTGITLEEMTEVLDILELMWHVNDSCTLLSVYCDYKDWQSVFRGPGCRYS